LYAVKVFDADSNGDTESIVCGLDWIAHNAASLGIRVVNMSLGGDGFDDHLCGLLNGDPEHQAICKLVDLKGLTVVVAAGNDAKDAASVIPASYDEVITVSALSDFNGAPGGGAPATCGANIDDTLYNKSNFGPDIDFIAPGSCITSTSTGTGYDLRSGTSMAAPHVAGAALLYLRLLPIATPGLVKLGLQLQANYDWDNSTDPDGIKEPLIDVSHL
jgi:subtilisin family serine protease